MTSTRDRTDADEEELKPIPAAPAPAALSATTTWAEKEAASKWGLRKGARLGLRRNDDKNAVPLPWPGPAKCDRSSSKLLLLVLSRRAGGLWGDAGEGCGMVMLAVCMPCLCVCVGMLRLCELDERQTKLEKKERAGSVVL